MNYRGFAITRSEKGRHIAESIDDDITLTSNDLNWLHRAISHVRHATSIVGIQTLRRIGVGVFAMPDWFRHAIATGKRTINVDSAMEA
jgi:hypothetical protein